MQGKLSKHRGLLAGLVVDTFDAHILDTFDMLILCPGRLLFMHRIIRL